MNYYKYFQFSGTINGTNYFLRQLLATLTAMVGGFGLGYSIASEIAILLLPSVAVTAGAIWFSLSTMYKRFTALQPDNAGLYTALLFSFQTLSTYIKDEPPYGAVIKLGLIIVGFYLIFSNSKITNHEG